MNRRSFLGGLLAKVLVLVGVGGATAKEGIKNIKDGLPAHVFVSAKDMIHFRMRPFREFVVAEDGEKILNIKKNDFSIHIEYRAIFSREVTIDKLREMEISFLKSAEVFEEGKWCRFQPKVFRASLYGNSLVEWKIDVVPIEKI